MNIKTETGLKSSARFALDTAMKMGSKSARITLNVSSQNSFSVRDGKLDRLHSSTGSSIYVQLYINDRYGSFSTNRIEHNELETLISRGVEATGYLEKDLFRGLPDKELYYKNDKGPLLQNDDRFFDLTPQQKKEIAFNCSSEILGKDKRLISVNSEYGDSDDLFYMVDSQGFEGESRQTLFSLSAECTVKGSADARPEAWWYEASMFFDTLKKENVGNIALSRALQRLNPKKMKTGKYVMVVENSVANRLISPILSALNGASIQQNNSFLKDSAGKRVFSPKMTLFDDAHNPKAMGARYFDGEGIATRPNEIISKGVINNYFINSYYSRKLKIPTTIEGPSAPILLASDNQHGSSIDLSKILGFCGKGILVTGFNGGNTNSSTGDFSFGIQGFYFDNGVILHPVKEMNVTGNLVDLWNKFLITGSDSRNVSRWQIPTVAFEEVSFSGI